MYRLITYATQQQSQEMSFIRRLVDYSRFLLRHHQILFGGGKKKIGIDGLPEKGRGLRVERRGSGAYRIVGGGPKNVAAPGPAISETAGLGLSGPSNRLLDLGRQIHSQVRQIFINNVLRRATTNQEIARKAAQRLLYGDSRPFFALVGVSLATGSAGVVSQSTEFDGICWEINESIRKQVKGAATGCENENDDSVISVEDLRFGELLNSGCNGVVYAATSSTNENLAVKMMFNYDIESNAFAILKGMVKEIVPARNVDLKSLIDLDKSLFENVKRCPPHDAIIDVKHAFVDKTPLLPEGLESYPAALPRRLNPDDGLARNMTLFLVMKRYDASLQEYLKSHPDIGYRTRLLILTQILNGVSHLVSHQIAHRDLKTDNILVDLSQGVMYPEVVISDFGCCLADKSNGLSLPFRTYDTDRGGNPALTSPEISAAVPGTWKNLDYRKSDIWTVGAISYEIFGNPNPFYGTRESPTSTRFDSRTYAEKDLPVLNGAVSGVQKLVSNLLRRNPDQRMTAEKAFNICILLLWAPTDWMLRSSGRCPNDDEILQWLLCLTAKALCHANEQLEFKIMRSFLRRVKFSSLKASIHWLIQSKEE